MGDRGAASGSGSAAPRNGGERWEATAAPQGMDMMSDDGGDNGGGRRTAGEGGCASCAPLGVHPRQPTSRLDATDTSSDGNGDKSTTHSAAWGRDPARKTARGT